MESHAIGCPKKIRSIPTRPSRRCCSGAGARRSSARYPSLKIVSVERLAGLSYPASGGFSRGALLPGAIWRALHRAEQRLPPAIFRLIGFRLLAVIERT